MRICDWSSDVCSSDLTSLSQNGGGTMSDGGFVKVYRSLLGHHVFRNDAEAMAFAWLVIRASWKPSRVSYKDRMLNLGRGQLAMSVRDMAAAMERDKTGRASWREGGCQYGEIVGEAGD